MKSNKITKLNTAQATTTRFGIGMLTPTMIVLLVMTAYPLIFTFIYSFTDYNYLKGTEQASFILFDNYTKLFKNGYFQQAVWNTIKFTILATLGDSWIYKHLNDPQENGPALREGFSRYSSQCPFDPQTSAVSVMKMTPFSWTRQRTRGGIAAGDRETKSFRLYYHYYFNRGKATLETTAFNQKLRRCEENIVSGVEMSESELKFAETYFSWKKVKGGKIKVTPNDDAIAETQKDFGVFVLVSNVHSDPWEALRLYRRRNEIEQSYRTVKTELDGRRIRVWTMRNVRGKELCRHVALGYRFALQKLVEKVVAEAKRRAGDPDSKAEEKKLYERVASWASELTVKQLLDWFDCVERVNVRNRQAQLRWSTETTKRDRAFLDLFFDQAL